MNTRSVPYLRILFFINIGALLFGVTHIALTNHGLSRVTPQFVATSTNTRFVLKQKMQQKDTNSTSGRNAYKVPNVVHYIWYNTRKVPFMFHHLLSVLSVSKVLKPDVIYFHTDMEPIGRYYQLAQLVPGFKVNYRKPPTELFGERVKTPHFYTSHSNVDRVKILREMGGIYLDFDMFVIRPFDDLRKHSCVIGQEQETKACGSAIICQKGAHFLDLWLNAYLDDYRMDEWAYNSGQVPFNLAKRFPHLCYIEPRRLNRPNFKELEYIWGSKRFDWRNNYALHIWYRIWKDMSPYYIGEDLNPDNIKTLNNTIGEIARSIYYGSPDIIPTDNIS